jgi:subtilase family serine protease
MLRCFRPAVFVIGAALIVASASAPARAGGASAESAAAQPAMFAVKLPLRNRPEMDALHAALHDPSSPLYHHWISAEEFARRFGPSSADKAAVARELRAAGFNVKIGSQAVFAHGSEPSAERYFHTNFGFRSPDGISRAVLAPRAPLQRSALLQSLGAHVVGLDGLPEWHSNAVFSKPHEIDPFNINGPLGPYAPPALRQAYEYPSYALATGAGVSIGIISSSPVSLNDVYSFVAGTGNYAPGNKYPLVYEFPIDGGGSYNASGAATGEVTLDVEYSLGSAPGATIGIFNIPALVAGELLEAYSDAMIAGSSIVSSSIGGCEKAYDTEVGKWELESLDEVFYEGALEGVTFVGASGDNGAFECGTGKTSASLSVQTPTDDPLMTGVGGTTSLRTTYVANNLDSAYVGETSYASNFTGHGGSVWGSDGGYSVIWARPTYQNGFVPSAGRGVPDVSMHMGGPTSADSTDQIIVAGQVEDVSGTSAAAPEFAGLLALRVQYTKKLLGDVNPELYALAKTKGSFRTGIKGNNGYYSTTAGLWDPVLGLGTPIGRVIYGNPKAALAGYPRSASNP